jgi:hypothetical protein
MRYRWAAQRRPALEIAGHGAGCPPSISPVFRDPEIAPPAFPVNVATIQEEITQL